MALTNTPLSTIEAIEKLFENHDGKITVDSHYLWWLLQDAKHLNQLNGCALEMRYEDAALALKALADYEK